jgi:UDP-N-acetylmuramate--alanine ligase
MKILNEFGRCRHFHFVGIGGGGMSALARLLLQQGHAVSGSDLSPGPTVEPLKALGATIFDGHSAGNLGNSDALVFSSAIGQDNPELVAARRLGIPVIHRSELLVELMRYRKGIAVAGCHGKTTTAAMVGYVLRKAGAAPTLALGARPLYLEANSELGSGDYFVAEADESDRSFLRFCPEYQVVTNVDLDHTDTYRNLEEVQEAFSQFILRTPFYGQVVACSDSLPLQQVLRNVHRRVVTYGLSEGADFRVGEIREESFGSSFTLCRGGESLGRISLRVGGIHNVLNAAATACLADILKVPFFSTRTALAEFPGVERRMEVKGERRGVLVMDDYAHHPVEVRATLEACRVLDRRLILVFQPHRYSRTASLMDDFAHSFDQADMVFLMNVYSAGEREIPGVSSRQLACRIPAGVSAELIESNGELIDRLDQECGPGDLLLTMGAGDVWKIGERFLERSN